jgi:hypothetical protein
MVAEAARLPAASKKAVSDQLSAVSFLRPLTAES